MNLKTYLASIDMTLTKFAQLVKAHPKYLGEISRGKKVPSKKLADAIFKATGGAVEPNHTKKTKTQE